MIDEEVAHHEAGHVVACVIGNLPFRYVTIRPRNSQHAGHVVTRRRSQIRTPIREVRNLELFEAEAVANAAGIIAEDLFILGNTSYDHERVWRKNLVRDAGRTDMKAFRRSSHMSYYVRRDNPEWSPESPVELAKRTWKRAVMLVATHWEAVTEIAYELVEERHTLTCAQVKSVMSGTEVMSNEEVKECLSSDQDWAPWFLTHSRLKWEPSAKWYAEVDKDIEWWRANG